MKKIGRFTKVFAVGFTLFFFVLTHPRFIGVDSAGVFSRFQFSWQDFLFQHTTTALKSGDPRLLLIAVDAESGKKFGFPLPRAVYGRMLDALKTLGVRTVVFDVMFFEPREGDAELAAATKRFGRVIHLFAQEEQLTSHGTVTTTSLPIDPLMKAGKHFGHPNINDLIDDDGHLRRYSLFRLGTPDPLRHEFHSVSLEAAAIAADQDMTIAEVRQKFGEDIRLLNFRLPAQWLRHEKRDSGRTIINLEKITSPYRHISLLDILSDDLTPDQRKALKGAMVIVGSTALGYYDHYPTPFVETAPGAEFHLNAIDNALHRDGMGSTSRLTTLGLIVAAIALTCAMQLLAPAIGAAMATVALLAWIFFSVWMFRRGIIVEFVPPAVAFLSSYLVLVVHRALTEGREKKLIKAMFGQFVSPEVVEQLAQDPSKVKLGGEKRDMTIFFLDIAHFTNISEKMDPEALIQFLNKYLSALSHVILERGGTIDKYIGDCVMAFWNAPVENKNHRRDAVLAAMDCQAAIDQLNKTLDPGVPEIPAVRIGINSGTVTVGLTGSEKKLQYTVIGDEVNLASRLEGANKFFGSKTIISESTYEGAKEYVSARALGRVRVVGKASAIKIFEPIGEKGNLDAVWQKALPLYEKGIAAFDERRYGEALESFQKFAEILPQDGPGQLYLTRCQEYAVLPPDATWDGVFNLTAK